MVRINPSPQMLLISVVLGGLVGIKGLRWVIHDSLDISASESWQQTTAIVDRAYLSESSGRNGTTMYSPEVDFHFKVGSENFLGNRFEIPPSRSDSYNFELGRTTSLVPGSAVPIYYDPADPRRSVLLRPVTNYWFTFGLGSIALGFLLAPIFLTFMYFRARRRS